MEDKNIENISCEELLNEVLNSIAKKLKSYESEVSYSIYHEINNDNKNILIKITFLPKTPSFYSKKECLITIDKQYPKLDIDSFVFVSFNGEEGKREIVIKGVLLPSKTQFNTLTNSLTKIKALISTALNSLLLKADEKWFRNFFDNKDIEEKYYIQLINEKYKEFASTLSEEERKIFYSLFREGYSISRTFEDEYEDLSDLEEKRLYYWFCSLISNPNFKEVLREFGKVIRESICMLKI